MIILNPSLRSNLDTRDSASGSPDLGVTHGMAISFVLLQPRLYTRQGWELFHGFYEKAWKVAGFVISKDIYK